MTTIRTPEDLDDWTLNVDDSMLLALDAKGQPWIVWDTEDGWHATRPPSEDDPMDRWGKGVTAPLDSLPLPLTIITRDEARELHAWLGRHIAAWEPYRGRND